MLRKNAFLIFGLLRLEWCQRWLVDLFRNTGTLKLFVLACKCLFIHRRFVLCSSFTKKYVKCFTSVFLNINGITLHYCEIMDYFLFPL